MSTEFDPRRNIPPPEGAEVTPAQGIPRREFLKVAGEIVVGSTLLVGGPVDVVLGARKENKLREQAEREAEARGIPRPDKKAFEWAKNFEAEIVKGHQVTRQERELGEYDQYAEVLAQAGHFDAEVKTLAKQKIAQEGHSKVRKWAGTLSLLPGALLMAKGIRDYDKSLHEKVQIRREDSEGSQNPPRK